MHYYIIVFSCLHHQYIRMRIWFSDEHAHSTHSMLGAQNDLFKQRAPPSTTIVNEITIMFALECLHAHYQHGSAHASPPWFNTRIMLQDAAFTGKQRAPFSTMIVTKPTILSMLECLCAHCQHMKLSMQALRHHHNSASECASAIQHGAWCRCVLGAQGVVFKWSAPSSTTIVAEIKLYLCLKNNIICLTGQHCAAEAARRPLRKKKDSKSIQTCFCHSKWSNKVFWFVFLFWVCVLFFSLGYWVLSWKPRRLTRDQLCAA